MHNKTSVRNREEYRGFLPRIAIPCEPRSLDQRPERRSHSRSIIFFRMPHAMPSGISYPLRSGMPCRDQGSAGGRCSSVDQFGPCLALPTVSVHVSEGGRRHFIEFVLLENERGGSIDPPLACSVRVSDQKPIFSPRDHVSSSVSLAFWELPQPNWMRVPPPRSNWAATGLEK